MDVFPCGGYRRDTDEQTPKTNTFQTMRKEVSGMAVFRIEKTRDYTVMSNHHLRNTDLSLKAKGLLRTVLLSRGRLCTLKNREWRGIGAGVRLFSR